MKRSREGTLCVIEASGGLDDIDVNKYILGVDDLLEKAERLSLKLQASAPNSLRATAIQRQWIREIRQFLANNGTHSAQHAMHCMMWLAIAYRGLLVELHADKQRRGLTIRDYLQARERLLVKSGGRAIKRQALARECGISLQKLREWEKKNLG